MKRALAPDDIVRAALQVLDEVGLDELSMRRVAEALGVQNPALYWHFRNKQELLDHMAQVLLVDGFASIDSPGPRSVAWAKRLAWFARGLREAMRCRKDGARVIASANLARPGSALLVRMDALVAALMSSGFRGADALRGVLALIHYTLGTTLEEQSDPRRGDPTMVPDAALPTLTALAEVLATGEVSQVDARFEFGVKLIIEGLRAHRRVASGERR